MCIETVLESAFDKLQHGGINSVDCLKIEKRLRKYFKGTLPKKYFIIPQTPYVYTLSNTLCIELPAYGSLAYRKGFLLALSKRLKEHFICDTIYYDGKITYKIRGVKDG